jgi:aminoglycoside phosphotransferase (APT) family kinase protein
MTDPVDAILAAHRIDGPWTPLNTTGLANRIYATRDVVLRIATDHPDAVPDARTESIAAPAAHAAGIRTPRLIAFDESRSIVDRPFSLWERVHGKTLGLSANDRESRARVWREIGQEIACLHESVRACPDPHGYLDTPGYELNLLPTLKRLVESGAATSSDASDIERLLHELAPHVAAGNGVRRFVHNDLHEMNVMCTPDGRLLALIDWGDAGWGDPALDFSAVPLDVMHAALDGYGSAARAALGAFPEARIVWSRLHDAMQDAIDGDTRSIPVDAFRRFLDGPRPI